MKRLLLPIIILGLLASLATPGTCLACSCVISRPDQAPARADVVFRGQLVTFSQQQAARYRSDGSVERLTQVRATFLVDTGWKGDVTPVLSVSVGTISGQVRSASTCDATLRTGRSYLVFATRGNAGRDSPPDILSTSFCAGTREIADAGDYLGALGPGTPVAASPVPPGAMAAGLALAAFDLSLSAGPRPTSALPHTPADRVPSILMEFGFVPSAIAVDRLGNIYVGDTADQAHSRHRVLKYAPSGQLLAAWGGATVGGPGQFLYPYGIAVDGQGYVYVADRVSGVQKLDPAGQPVPGWPARAEALNEVQFPIGLATDGQENLYVTDVWGHTVSKFSATGEPLAIWGAQGSGPAQFRAPGGVAVDARGNIYVADVGNHRIQKFSPTGTFLLQWGREGSATGEFAEPYSVALDRQGNVYVADRRNNRVQQFTGAGQFIAQWGGEGSAPGQFRNPYAIAAGPSGAVYVADLANYRVQRIPSSGQP